MVAADGRVKLADFGIASLQEDTQRTLTAGSGPDAQAVTAVFGSLPFVAPEQARGERAGPAADLWALGATLWFAVEGVAPFERAGPAATLAAVLHDPPGRPGRAGPLEPVLLALLAKDPSIRPATAAVRGVLAPVAAGSSGPTVPLTGTARLPTDPAAPTGILADSGGVAGPASPPAAGGVAGPAPPPGWGEPRPVPRRRPRGRVQLPGWTAPPRRKRRWGRRLLIAAAVLALLALASNLGENDRRAGGGPAGLGDPVRDGQFEFVVRSVDCGAAAVGEDFTRKTAQDQFCLVALEVENTGTEGRTFGGGQQFLFDTDGNRHDPDLDATARHEGGGRLWSSHLNPGQRLEGTLVYDVPDSITLSRMELHDGPLSGGATVELS
jgi:hypothetical protein